MNTKNVNIEDYYVGDSVASVITLTDATTGAAINISGYTFYFTMKYSESDLDASAIISKTFTPVGDGSTGKVILALSSADTSVESKNYFYDLRYKDGSGNKGTLLNGKFYLNQSITRTIA